MGIRLNHGIGCVASLGIVFGPGLLAASLLHSAVWAVVGPLAVIGILLGVAALPIKRKVTAHEFADELERHLRGTDDDDDWDRTSSVRIADPLLEEVRQSLDNRFASLSQPENREELRRIIEALRRGERPRAVSKQG